jgi:hypothetical protein
MLEHVEVALDAFNAERAKRQARLDFPRNLEKIGREAELME